MTLSKTEFWPPLVKKCMISIIFSLAMMPLVSKADEKTLLVQYAPGEIMQLIAPVTEPEKRALRDRYFEQNAEILQNYFVHPSPFWYTVLFYDSYCIARCTNHVDIRV